MNKSTFNSHIKTANTIMYYIYTHIEVDIDLDALSREIGLSKFYMHKVFKEVFGRNIYESIKSIRLQKAASLLLTNKFATISEVAALCGYSSHSSFIKAFKEKFASTPKEWRKGAYKQYSDAILQASNLSSDPQLDFSKLSVKVVNKAPIESFYIRNKGYINNVKETWQKLYTFVLNNDVHNYEMIALLHDNPTITPLDDCQYIACIATKEHNEKFAQRLPKFKIAGGVYLQFDLQGKGKEMLYFIHWLYHDWLVDSDYETTTKPSYVVYHKNNYLEETNQFDISYYLPVNF